MNKFRLGVLGGAKAAPTNPLVTSKTGGDALSDRVGSIEISREAERTADHRDEDRHRLGRETATIAYKGKKISVDLVNLSGGGAMIEAALTPRLWDRVDLYLGDGSPIECAVRWLRKGRIGLEFAHETRIECAPEQRNALLLDVIRRSFPDLAGPAAPAAPSADAPAADTAPVPAASRRADSRHPLIWNGTILWQHDAHPVRLRNISVSGALVDSQIDLPEGAELLLDLGESGQFFATVSWSRGGQAGLVFAEPFDVAVLAAQKPEIAPQRWNRPNYLDLTADQASPWASEWERSDLGELSENLEGFLRH